jgi:hypothetical protein
MSVEELIVSIRDCSGSHSEQLPAHVGERIIAALRAGRALAQAVYSGESDRITEAMTNYMKEDV